MHARVRGNLEDVEIGEAVRSSHQSAPETSSKQKILLHITVREMILVQMSLPVYDAT